MGSIQRFCLLLSAILMSSELGIYGNIAMVSWWIRGTGPAGSPSDYNNSFMTKTPSEIGCVHACRGRSLPCFMVSYHTPIQECYGYASSQQQFTEVDKTMFWKLVERRTCTSNGYRFNPAFNTCIRLYNVRVNWSEAESLCRKDTGYLIVADSLVKLDAIQKTFPGITGWIGLREYSTQEGARNFMWINGKYESQHSPLWYIEEPNSKDEQCVDTGRHPGRLNDHFCKAKLAYICQQDI